MPLSLRTLARSPPATPQRCGGRQTDAASAGRASSWLSMCAKPFFRILLFSHDISAALCFVALASGRRCALRRMQLGVRAAAAAVYQRPPPLPPLHRTLDFMHCQRRTSASSATAALQQRLTGRMQRRRLDGSLVAASASFTSSRRAELTRGRDRRCEQRAGGGAFATNLLHAGVTVVRERWRPKSQNGSCRRRPQSGNSTPRPHSHDSLTTRATHPLISAPRSAPTSASGIHLDSGRLARAAVGRSAAPLRRRRRRLPQPPSRRCAAACISACPRRSAPSFSIPQPSSLLASLRRQFRR